MLRSLMKAALSLFLISVASVVFMIIILKASDEPIGTAHLQQPPPAPAAAKQEEGPPGPTDVIYAGRNMIRQLFQNRIVQGSVRFHPVPHASYSWKKIDDARYEAAGIAFVRLSKHIEDRRPFVARMFWYEPSRTWTPYYVQIGTQILIDDE